MVPYSDPTGYFDGAIELKSIHIFAIMKNENQQTKNK